MAIGAITCTGASFVNFTLFNILKIGEKPNRFAVFIEPLTQIDLIVRYAPVLYGTNALIGMVNACIIAFSGLKIGVTVWQHLLQVRLSYLALTIQFHQRLQSSP